MNAGSIIATLKLKTEEFRQGINEAKAQVKSTSDAFKEIGKVSMAVGATIATGLGMAVKTTADFEAGMSRVGAVANATDKELEAMTQTALKLGAETSFSSSQAAEGMQYLAMAGFKANEIIAAMPGVLDMAAAGQVALGDAANIASNIMSGFGMEAGKAGQVADVLSKTFTSSNTTLSSLGETMKYAAPVAHSVGWSLEEMAAAAGKLGDAGIDGSMAGTALRAAVVRLSAPTDEAAGLLDKLGVKTTNAKGQMLPLADILEQLNKGMSSYTDTQKAAATQTIFGTVAMSSMLTLMQNTQGVKDFTAELQNAGGTADKIASKQLDNLNGAIEALGGSFETIQIAIGQHFIPLVRGVAEGLTALLNWFAGLNPEVQKFIAYFLGISAAGLIVIGAVALVIGWLPKILGFFGNVTKAVQGLGTALTWLTTNPIGLIILAIVALIAIFVYLWKTNEDFRNKVIEIWNAIVAFVTPIIQTIVGFLREQFASLAAWWNEIMPQFLQAVQNVWNMIWAVLKPIIDAIVAIISWAMPFILVIVQSVWNNIKGVIQGALGIIKGVIEVFTYLFTGQWSKLWESIKNLVASAWQFIWNLFQLWATGKLLKGIFGFGKAILGWLGSLISSVFGSIGSFIMNIVSKFTGLFSSVTGIFGSIGSFIKGVFSGLIGTVLGSLTSLISGIKDKVTKAKEWLSELNPFKRHSPSLVDNVLAGVKQIKDTYRSVSDMEIKPPGIGSITPGRIDVAGIVAGSGSGGSGETSTNYNAPLVQVDKMEVRNDQDIRNVSSELYNLQRNAERSRGR